MRTTRNRNGITLIELILAAAIVSVVAMAIYTIMVTGVRVYNKDVTYHTDQSALRQSMMKIEKEVRKASSATASATQVILNYSNPTATKSYWVSAGNLNFGTASATTLVATDISAVSSAYDSSTKMLTILLTAKDGTTLSSRMHMD